MTARSDSQPKEKAGEKRAGPLYLKQLMADSHVSLNDLRQRLIHPHRQAPISLSGMHGVVATGRIPKTWPEDDFRGQLEAAAIHYNLLPEEKIAHIWDLTGEEIEPTGSGRTTGDRRINNQPDYRQGVTRVNVAKESLSPAVLSHFGLGFDPFSEVADFSRVWLSQELQTIKQTVAGAIHRRAIMALIGDVGAGKSTLLRNVMTELISNQRVRLIWPNCLNRYRMDGDAIVTEILNQMGVDLPATRLQRNTLVQKIMEKEVTSGVSVALIIDEAHDLPDKALIALKRLWDSAMLYKLCSIVLVGQGGDRKNGGYWGLKQTLLGVASLRELTERTVIIDMPKLRNGQMGAYLDWRLKDVGSSVDAVFDPDAVRALAIRADGCAQLANNLAIRAMRRAKQCGEVKVTKELVASA